MIASIYISQSWSSIINGLEECTIVEKGEAIIGLFLFFFLVYNNASKRLLKAAERDGIEV